MVGNTMGLWMMLAVTLGCFAFVIFSIRKLKKNHDKNRERLERISQAIAKSRNKSSE